MATTADAFICHASEDKQEFVRPLAQVLREYGANVWFDEFELRVGDSLSRTIDKGLANAKFGIVVLSKAFFAKSWPEYELRALFAKEIGASNVILSIWLGVDREAVLKYSPMLAGKVALVADQENVEQLAVTLLETVRPDLFQAIQRSLMWREAASRAERRQLSPEEAHKLHVAPIRHQSFPQSILTRIRFIRAALLRPSPHSMGYWVDGFQRDLHPEQEISWWERLASVYLEMTQLVMLTPEQHDHAYTVLFSILNGNEKEQFAEHLTELPDDLYEKLLQMATYVEPPFDFEEELPPAEGGIGFDDFLDG